MKPLMPTEIKLLCEQYDLRPSKHYGQNYLLSEKVIEEMVAAAEITTNDTVVEIGPGFGILTLALAEKAKRVVAFEIEQKLRSYWEEKNKEYPNVEIVWGNALNRLRTTVDRLQTDDCRQLSVVSCPYKVLANIPYHITSQILRTLLELEHKPARIVVMLQKEVAERICAKKGSMNLLALSVQYYGTPTIVVKVPRTSFWPVPKVDSAVIAVDIFSQRTANPSLPSPTRGGTVVPEKIFFQIAKAGFSHPRKQLWSNLAHGLHIDSARVKDALREVAGNEKIRAEDVGFEEWMAIAAMLAERL